MREAGSTGGPRGVSLVFLIATSTLVHCGSQGAAHGGGGVSADASSHDATALHDAGSGDARHVVHDAEVDATSPTRDADLRDAPIADADLDDPCLPFTMPSSAALFGSSKKVFAHYFYPFPLSEDDQPAATDYYDTQYLVPDGEHGAHLDQGGFLRQRPLPVPVSDAGSYALDNMKREVRMAIADGITGFTFDVLGASQANAGSQLQNLLAAATAVDSRFKIVVMPDLSALAEADAGAEANVVESVILSVAKSPAAYHLADGRLVVSSFYAEGQPAAWWTSLLASLSSQGVSVAFVPVFLNLGANQAAFAPISYGLSLWGTATPASATATQTLPASAHDAGDIFMMPILSQQYRPKDFIYWEAQNSETFRNSWSSAITGGADWIQIVTWNDFSESGEIEPYTDITLAPDIGTGYYDLNAYYASWFLTGAAPTITHDVLYYFYRREPTTAADPAQTQPTTDQGGIAGYDVIELLAFLTAPGTLSITLDGQTSTENAPAGLTSMIVPLQAGTPTFKLLRASENVISFTGGVVVYGDGGLPGRDGGAPAGVLDLTYWTGSASASGTCSLAVP